MTIETNIIDGKKIASALRQQLKLEVDALKLRGITPSLAVVLVGDDPASHVYVRNKIKACVETGIRSIERRLSVDVSEAELLAEVEALNQDASVHGILVQLPLPKHIHESTIIHAIRAEKDVDGFHPLNIGKLWLGEEGGLLPCTPTGCMILLKSAMPELSGKRAVIIGRSNIVGKPIAAMLLKESCTVTIAHSKTQDLPALTREADIVIAAVGRPEMVKGDWIKSGAVVIDVGINRITLEGGASKLVGDVAYAECSGKAGAITPVPGGVGPMTIACLLQNTVKAANE